LTVKDCADTAMEINAFYLRLDLNDVLARRAWLEKNDLLNCLKATALETDSFRGIHNTKCTGSPTQILRRYSSFYTLFPFYQTFSETLII